MAKNVCVRPNIQARSYGYGFTTYSLELTSRLRKFQDLSVDPICFSISNEQLKNFDFPVRRVDFSPSLVFYRVRASFTKIFRSINGRKLAAKIGTASPDEVYIFFENKIPIVPIKGKIIAVIHDIIPLKIPFQFTRKNIIHWHIVKRDAKDILKRADKIITVSNFSRDDIAKFFHVDKNKIEVVYNGVNVSQFSSQNFSESSLREKYNLPEKYILYFGSCIAHKNVRALISAYAALPENIREKYKLVITNPNDEIKNFVNDLGIYESVCYLAKIPEEEKPAIYKMSSLFVWLSLYEGFGLSILEAMASGVPVVCSNVTAMPEVAGDAAILFDPKDTNEISRAIEKVLCDENLRGELIAKGYENIKRFSWDESAKKLHDIIINL